MSLIDISIIIIYLVGILGIGVYARHKITTVDDYLIAGRRFSTFSLVGTIMASLIGAGMVMGVVGNIYKYGSGIFWNYIGFAVGLFLFGMFLVEKTRTTQKRTMAEIIAGKFGRLPRFWCGIFAALYSFAIMIIGVTGMARLLTYIFSNTIPIIPATIISVIVAIVLTAFGGLYSVIWTDTLQFGIMILIIVIIGPIIAILKVGSLTEINNALESCGGSLINFSHNVPKSYMAICLITIALAVPGDPTVPQRALAGKDTAITKKAFYISGILALVFGFAILIIGGASVVLLPDIAEKYGTAEAALPAFIINYFPPVLAGLGISALLAAIISTITSMLLVGTTHLIYDVGQSLFPNALDETLKKLIPLFTVIFGSLIIWLSLQVSSIGDVVYFAFSLCGAAFVIPMIAILYWKKTTKWGITLGIIGGAMAVLVMYAINNMGPGGDPVFLGLVLSFLLTITGSLLFKDNKTP